MRSDTVSFGFDGGAHLNRAGLLEAQNHPIFGASGKPGAVHSKPPN